MCKHSARKMQWAVHYYKSHGGTYAGKKSPSNKLHQWTKQKWRTASGKKSEGKRRYLPAEAWKHLTKKQIKETNRLKQKGYAKGKQGEAAEGRGARRKEVPSIAKSDEKKDLFLWYISL